AAIVAETRRQAEDAADLVSAQYEELPCVVDARRAVEAGAPLVWQQATGNIAAEAAYGDVAAVDKAFAAAAHITELELHNQRLVAAALEPRCSIGVFADGRTTLYTQNQTPSGARELLGAVFRRRPEEFRVAVGDIGGGFGMKTGLAPEDALVCYAAKKLGRPVKWRGERSEEFLAAHMGRGRWGRQAGRAPPPGAADGEGRARDAARPRRDPAAQFHPAGEFSLSHAPRRCLRQRQFPWHRRPACRAGRLAGFRGAARAIAQPRAAAGPGAVGLPGMDRRPSDRDGQHPGRRLWHGHGVLRHAGDGAGAGNHIHAAARRGAGDLS